MKVNMKLLIGLITFLPLLVYSIIYGLIGETIPISWNEFGEVTGYMTKTIAIFVIPLTAVFVSAILYYVHQITNKRKLLGLRYSVFTLFVSITMAFITLFPLYLISSDGGNTYNVIAGSLLVTAGLILIAGFIFPKFKYDGKYGFITPWTKASSNVFYKTQQMASATFLIGSLFLGGLTLFMEEHMTLAVVSYVLVCLIMILIPLLYSKNLYENED